MIVLPCLITVTYAQLSHTFINTAHIDDCGVASDVKVDSYGTVFLANHNDGLHAYTYEGTSFTNTAHIDDGSAWDVAVDSDGTVFIANSPSGLFAYIYERKKLSSMTPLLKSPM